MDESGENFEILNFKRTLMSNSGQEPSIGASQVSRRNTTSQELNVGLSKQFLNPTENITAVEISNEKQATKEIKNIIAKFKENMHWSDQFQLVQQLMAIVKGGAAKYQGFADEISGLLTMLTFCVNNLRSTLVKHGCLCIACLAQSLKEKFDPLTEPLISALIVPTMHGTSVIAKSCRFSIREIINNVFTKRTLLCILSFSNSKSSEHRNIVADSLKDVAFSWPRNLINSNIKQIEQAVKALTNDATKDTRAIAKSALEIFENNGYITPTENKSSRKFQEDKTEIIQFVKLEPPIRPKYSSPQKNTKHTSSEEITQINISSLDLSKKSLSKSKVKLITEENPTELVKISKITNDPTSIKDNAQLIVDTLMKYIKSKEIDELTTSFNLLDKVIGIIFQSFEGQLKELVEEIVDKSEHTSFQISKVASNLLNSIPSIFNCADLLKISFDLQPSRALISFVSVTIRKDPSLIEDDEIAEMILKLCCKVNEKINETRTNATISTIVNEIQSKNTDVFVTFLNTADKRYIDILNNLKLVPSTPIKTTPKKTKIIQQSSVQFKEIPQQKTETISSSSYAPAPLRSSFKITTTSQPKVEHKTTILSPTRIIENYFEKLMKTDDKQQALIELANSYSTNKVYSLDHLRIFSKLIRTEFQAEVQSCLENVISFADTYTLMSDCLGIFFMSPNTETIDTLSYILQKTSKTITNEKAQLIFSQLSDCVNSEDPEMRLATVKCIAATIKNVGCDVNQSLTSFTPVQTKLVQYYYNKL